MFPFHQSFITKASYGTKQKVMERQPRQSLLALAGLVIQDKETVCSDGQKIESRQDTKRGEWVVVGRLGREEIQKRVIRQEV